MGVVERIGDLGPQARDLAEINRLGLAGERAAGRFGIAANEGIADSSARVWREPDSMAGIVSLGSLRARELASQQARRDGPSV